MTACRHCGLDVPTPSHAAPGGLARHDPSFCCAGCEAAYALIKGAGLGDYYKRRILDPDAAPMRPLEDAAAFDAEAFSHANNDGTQTLYLMVEGLQCAACVWLIETVLARTPGVQKARLNMTTRRLALTWNPDTGDIGDILAAVTGLGYRVMPYDPVLLERETQKRQKDLLRAMAVAGFAAANVMLLSVAVWSGAGEGSGGGAGPATQATLHWLSALIALPAILYAGLPFFRSAITALRHRRTNMDVPISLAVTLTAGMSLFETARGGDHVYFESAVMLLFFLLIGRYLDRRARGRAHEQAERLTTLGGTSVTIINTDGTRRIVAANAVAVGDTVLVAPGERVPVDGTVLSGTSDLDCSLITGEALPQAAAPGQNIYAGTTNITAALQVRVTARGENTLLAEIARLMETAEQGRGRYVALADRVARLYAPVVHGLALLTFLGWTLLTPMIWQDALLIAVAVLIITCPCALALAVPIVQVVASARLMRGGVLIKAPTALERLETIDTVVFDKTGTLTEPTLRLTDTGNADAEALTLAAGMAANSAHPLAQALVRAHPAPAPLGNVIETPGAGLSLASETGEVRLGRHDWVLNETPSVEDQATADAELWLARPNHAPQRFGFAAPLRMDATPTVAVLKAQGLDVHLLSGDRTTAVKAAAEGAGISSWHAEQRPGDKVAFLNDLAARGHHVLMVGDGLNDAPALAAAYVSASPGQAADITRNAADVVFQGFKLAPLLDILTVTHHADRLVKQNLGFAFLYNAVTIPLAVAGLVTPLIAAASMSASSLVVIVNALRLGRRTDTKSLGRRTDTKGLGRRTDTKGLGRGREKDG